MAPCTVLQEKPGIVFNVVATNSARLARLARLPWMFFLGSANFHQQPDLLLLEPGVIAGLARFWWVGDDVHARLPEHSGAELGADRLLQQGHHVVVHVHHLGISTPEKKSLVSSLRY